MRTLLCISLLICASCKQAAKPESKKQEVQFSQIEKLKTLDIKLDKPQPGEWLHEHKESGQDFFEYVNTGPVRPDKVKRIIYLQPIGHFNPIQEKLLADVAEYVSIYFTLETIVLKPIQDSLIPSGSRRMGGEAQEQLHTKFILDMLSKKIPSDAIVVMGITPIDLFPQESWNFVFGQADLKKRIGVSSFHRYSEGPLDSLNYMVCLERIIKTSAHEIGHMFSIKHCTYAVCLMNGSNSLPESDSRPNTVCSQCLKKLCWNLGFNVQKRLENLQAYFAKHGLVRDQQLIAGSIDIIKSGKK